MNLQDCKNQLLTLLRNVPPFGGVGARKPYSVTALRNAYPRADSVVPTVTLSESGGPLPRPVGMGTSRRRHDHSLQMNVLGRDPMEAARIWERVAQAIREDYDYYQATGVYGKGYLRAQGVRSVVVGEPGQRPWDDENRIARLAGDVVLEFDDD